MSEFTIHKLEAINRLEFGPKVTSTELQHALENLIAVCKRGEKLEAENADLRNQLRDALERC